MDCDRILGVARPWEELKFRRVIVRFVRLRNFGVVGGVLRKGSRDPYSKGQVTFIPTATGEPKRGYRRIGNGAEAWSALMLRHGQHRS